MTPSSPPPTRPHVTKRAVKQPLAYQNFLRNARWVDRRAALLDLAAGTWRQRVLLRHVGALEGLQRCAAWPCMYARTVRPEQAPQPSSTKRHSSSQSLAECTRMAKRTTCEWNVGSLSMETDPPVLGQCSHDAGSSTYATRMGRAATIYVRRRLTLRHGTLDLSILVFS
jgi:hypothetical protein